MREFLREAVDQLAPFVFHVTDRRNVSSIMQSGLRPRAYVFTSEEDARDAVLANQVWHEEPDKYRTLTDTTDVVILKVEAKGFYSQLRADPEWEGTSAVYLDDEVPAVAIVGMVGEAASELPFAETTEGGVRFKTGTSVTFPYIRNTQASAQMGSRFQQDIEPAGRYMMFAPGGSVSPGWESGRVKFKRPLVLALNTDPSGRIYDDNSWKAHLHRHYGKRGKALSNAIRKDGYDGIVTIDLKYNETSEIVDLAGVVVEESRAKDDLADLPYEIRKDRYVKGFQRRFPALRKLIPRVGVSERDEGPEARTEARRIVLFPKFWNLDESTRDEVFAHEVGHWTLAEGPGLVGLTKIAADHGVDVWDTTSLPFGEFNFDEAFAAVFAVYHRNRRELERRYPAWVKVVEAVLEA